MDRVPFRPVAIVGIAALLPGSGDDPERFAELLEHRADLVGPVPDDRRRDAGLGPDAALAEAALLDRIDTFDHTFFGLSLREARQMDPQQRLLLELTCRAMWDAGYPLSTFRGSRTTVVVGAGRDTYAELPGPDAAPLVTGSLPSAQAGRVAHLLDLRGPALTIDTACSSSLAAVHEACRKLSTGEADWAVTGGVRLLSNPPGVADPGGESIVSPGGRSRSFDAAADGTGLGEGGVVFLLKPLDLAERDGDPIRAVVLGGAVNHDGGRSNGFAAPSAEAQEEMLLEAWRTAGVHPNSLGLIEAHGTGTRLGDPIEFEALSAAFRRRTERTGFCVLGSVKSNIGHLDSAAGAAGLLKTVKTLEHGRRYASAHFTEPNPLLETDRSALRLSTRTEPWETSGPRRAGVSAFGLTGTNVHLVLEQAPPGRRETPIGVPRRVLIPLSARSEGALRRHAARLAAHLRAHPEPAVMADLAFVQATGRDHERRRATVCAATAEEAATRLEELAAGDTEIARVPDATVLIMLLPDEGGIDPGTVGAWTGAFPSLAEWRDEQRVVLDGLPARDREAAESLIDRHTIVRALFEAGLSDRVVIGHGSGNPLVDVLRGETDPVTAARGLTPPGTAGDPDAHRTETVFATIAAEGDPVFITPWPGRLAELAGELAPRHRGVLIDAAHVPGRDPRDLLLDILGAAYEAGVEVDWERCVRFSGGYGRRAPMPTSLFEPIRCWAEPGPRETVGARGGAPAGEAPAESSHLSEDDGTEAERKLAAVWCALLGSETVSRDDDFFDLGGDSLMQVQLGNAVERKFGFDLPFDVVYEHPILRDLAAYLLEHSVPGRAEEEIPAARGPVHDPERDHAPVTHSQRRMWLLQQLAPTSGAYNVATVFHPDGPVDADVLRRALDGLVARHDILRTRLVLEDGELLQRVTASGAWNLDVIEREMTEQEAEEFLRDHAGRPFDLAEPGAARALLLVDPADPAHHRLQLVLHHAICDEWSMNLLVKELARDYDTLLRGSSPPRRGGELQFADWAAWEHGLDETPARAEAARHWRGALAGAPTELDLPTDFPHGTQQDDAGAWLPVRLEADTVSRMREEARARGGTLFTWLMTGYAAWLARLTQSEDFLVGVPVAGRHRAETESLLGCFVNTLPVRINAGGDPTFAELFARVRDTLAGAFTHQRHPFDLMVEESGVARDAARPPLVQTVLSLQAGGETGDGAGPRLGDTALRPLDAEGTVAWFDVSAVLWEADGGLSGILAYRTALFEEATIKGFRQDWLALTEAGLTHPHASVHTLLDNDAW
ncbi:condensation domain-containing protein [Streptomyces sp. ST2-7A]|uniref:condensation domain-containing protein n=1 Tax=Streptomyces sp. ST2-7A TaxID=2907214 RepID=UPI001F1F01E1|nr:condensation domain-containing protein [Streptomyces sp. ST2-7A]MCE7082630.1 condensation domain-containing protein [Streptomyces sp. ST2-7A]